MTTETLSVTAKLNALNNKIDTLLKFVDDVQTMRELQNELIDLSTALTNDEFCEIICKQNEATKAAEKQVDDFIAKRRGE